MNIEWIERLVDIAQQAGVSELEYHTPKGECGLSFNPAQAQRLLEYR